MDKQIEIRTTIAKTDDGYEWNVMRDGTLEAKGVHRIFIIASGDATSAVRTVMERELVQ